MISGNLVRLVANMRREGKSLDEIAADLGIGRDDARKAVTNAYRFPTTGRTVKRRRRVKA